MSSAAREGFASMKNTKQIFLIDRTMMFIKYPVRAMALVLKQKKRVATLFDAIYCDGVSFIRSTFQTSPYNNRERR